MGWETNVITQITFNKETYDSIYKVEEELEFCNKRIKEIVNSIMMYSTSRPQDILLNREEATLETIQEDIEDKLELLEEYFVKRNALEILKENFKCVDGDFIDNPNRKENIKKWLIYNGILDKEDFSNNNINNNFMSISNERVDHPSHYTWIEEKCGIEVIDITRHLDFDLGNAIKYILRSGHKEESSMTNKEKEIEDLQKAIWYLNDKINMIENEK